VVRCAVVRDDAGACPASLQGYPAWPIKRVVPFLTGLTFLLGNDRSKTFQMQ